MKSYSTLSLLSLMFFRTMPPHISFRTLQFNVLADGLGLLQRNSPNNTKQHSFLSKVSDEHLSWEYRKLRLMVWLACIVSFFRLLVFIRCLSNRHCFSSSHLVRERSLSIPQILLPCKRWTTMMTSSDQNFEDWVTWGCLLPSLCQRA